MRKIYEEPEFDLIKLSFEGIMEENMNPSKLEDDGQDGGEI